MYHIIYNPLANRGKKGSAAKALEQLIACLKAANLAYVIHSSTAPGHVAKIVQSLPTKESPCHIIIVGGDGTIFEAINGLEPGNSAILGIIPAGTGNDISKMIGIPKNATTAAQIIFQNRTVCADVALINSNLKSALFVSYGIAADIVLGMALLKRKTRLSYFTTLLRCVFGYKPKKITVKLNEQETTYAADFLSVHNCICAGGGMHLAHNAKIDDGRLDLVIVEYQGFFRRMANIISILTKKLHKQPNFKTIPIENIEIFSPNENRCVVDGEIREYDYLKIQVIPNFVKFYVNEVIE